jgi:hypothetical protein
MAECVIIFTFSLLLLSLLLLLLLLLLPWKIPNDSLFNFFDVGGRRSGRGTYPLDLTSGSGFATASSTEGVSVFRMWQLAGSRKFINVSTLKTDAASSPRNYGKFLPIYTALHPETQ